MLEEHIKKLQAKQEATKKKFKHDANMYEKRLVEIDQENKVLGVKLKEKGQEVKLHELKVRELKKAIPNTRLRPLKSRHNTVDQGNVLFKSKVYEKVGSRFRADQLYQDEGKALTQVYQGIEVNRKLQIARFRMSDPQAQPHPPLKFNYKVHSYGTPGRAPHRGRSLHPHDPLPMALIREKSHQANLNNAAENAQSVPHEKGPKLAERSQRSRQRARMGIRSQVGHRISNLPPQK